jgi:hypothetical protein
MGRNARTLQRRFFRSPARHRRARHALPAPFEPAAPPARVTDLDAWGAAAIELGLVAWPLSPDAPATAASLPTMP